MIGRHAAPFLFVVGPALAAVAIAAAAAGSIASGPAVAEVLTYREHEIQVESRRSGVMWGRFDSDERLDLIVGNDTELRLWLQGPDGQYQEPIVSDLGAEIGGGLYDSTDLDGDGRLEVVAIHASAVDAWSWNAEQGRMVRLEDPLVPRLRGLPFLHLLREDVVYDMDGDGDEDLMVPGDGRYHFYLRESESFELAGQVRTRPARIRATVGPPELSGRLRSGIRLPRLRLETPDDGEGFALLLPDGSYLRGEGELGVLSEDVNVTPELEDPLASFRARHGIDAGRREGFAPLKQDADGDGINDYVIAWKNRIWVYLGTHAGVDFDKPPDQLLKVSATDQMAALLLPLNDDSRPDLVLFKYQIPSIARLAAALVIGLRGELEILGYYNDGKPVFARKPSHRATFSFSIPPLLTLIGEIEEIADDFQTIVSPLNAATTADFNGDGVLDIMRVYDGHFELFLTRDGEPPTDLSNVGGYDFINEHGGHELFVEALFSKKRRDVSLDSGMQMMRESVDTIQASIMGGRNPDQRIPTGIEPRRIREVVAKDLDGDRRADIAVFVQPPGPEEVEAGADPDRQSLRLWMSAAPTEGG